MAHVELSVSESFAADGVPMEPTSSLEHWAGAVSTATEPCVVVDSFSMIVAASPAACTLLGFATQADAVGRHLVAGVLRLLDFTSEGGPLPDRDRKSVV